ncbi:SDR family NAD(P)-dependent oxidoreductase [Amycolatopsis rubida]|uniref:3-oxoacyl-[acyl-carrier protein] reductase/2-keto-3-deoxy-L-fuconate dehydrogenase n=1 Tax=Amycolatopsis rubida TaxID=112413 RepID=A0A1I5TCI1_9PSEU|nr:SDR family NAD(P)-dependent oxidoreductase [Amycolatopsis rubida]SFP80136.1 3-oxoacyl-[acyl-carrier protein] reductase/2-keto-3-deoxy-L-fuconate dehydrogenase [Amycolatopsis rubida]
MFAVDLEPDSESAPGIVPVQCDVSDPRAAAASVLADAGQIDVLVNGAGLVSVTRPVESIADGWARLTGVNLSGAFPGRTRHCPE